MDFSVYVAIWCACQTQSANRSGAPFGTRTRFTFAGAISWSPAAVRAGWVVMLASITPVEFRVRLLPSFPSSFIVTAGGHFHQEKNSARSKLFHLRKRMAVRVGLHVRWLRIMA
jgi:hypothetical protein